MTTVVRSLAISSRADLISCSVLELSEDVASSSIKIGGAFKIVRAIATRCFSPPDNLRPRSPIACFDGKQAISQYGDYNHHHTCEAEIISKNPEVKGKFNDHRHGAQQRISNNALNTFGTAFNNT